MLSDEFLRSCDGVGGLQVYVVRGFEEVGGQGESPGGASGRIGGIGEEFKDQDVGKGRRIQEGERYGGIGVDSSEERAGSEDCRHTGIEQRVENVVNCRMIGTEDCRIGGNSCSENVGVGGDVNHDLCVGSLKSCRQRKISSHMNMLEIAIEDRRNQVRSWNFDMCHIDRHYNFVHDGRAHVDRDCKSVGSDRQKAMSTSRTGQVEAMSTSRHKNV